VKSKSKRQWKPGAGGRDGPLKVVAAQGRGPKIPFQIKPYPEDLTQGKPNIDGSFRFNRGTDAMEWAKQVWSNPENQMHAYVYRQHPVCNFELSLNEPFPELGHNISRWQSWPFDGDDYLMGMYSEFGSGRYMILFQCTLSGRKIAKVEGWELTSYANYPPKIRVDDVVVDAQENRGFVAWARNAGVLFSHDKGYEPGKFVHIETQRHKNTRGEDDDMAVNPMTEAVATATGTLLGKAIENLSTPATTPQQQSSLDHLAAANAINLMAETTKGILESSSRDNSFVVDIVKDLIKERTTVATQKTDNGMEAVIKAIQETNQLQIKMLMEDRKDQRERINELERARSIALTTPPIAPEDAAIAYIEKFQTLAEKLGLSRGRSGGGAAPVEKEESSKDLIGVIVENLPNLLNTAAGAFQTWTQAQLRIAELQAQQQMRMAGGVGVSPGGQPQSQGVPPQSQPPQQYQPQGVPPGVPPQPNPMGAQPQPSNINEAARKEIGENFDGYVTVFHPELDKMRRVIVAKWMAGLSLIQKDNVTEEEEAAEIMADFGAELGDWYGKQPGNAYDALVGYRGVFLDVLKTYLPVWQVMGPVPVALREAFIDGFCDPTRLDEEASGPADAIDPEIVN
jgi:hypothetical protein